MTPALAEMDAAVLDEIETMREQLRLWLRQPRRWRGQLRRNLKARAVRGSNSIEGYQVTLDDAVAMMEDQEPLDADRQTALEITGYRNALTYIQQLAGDPHFTLDETLVRGLHFMMLGHDLGKRPGQYRLGPIYVHDDENEVIAYEGPAAEQVPALMAELVSDLGVPGEGSVYVRAAMAHLNLVMIHPFKDGNGRMARALQSLVLSRDGILAPEFSSIEEWLGRNTQGYYDVLALTGAGAWHPERDASEWVRFNLRAHHMQAQTVLRRVDDAARTWAGLEQRIAGHGLPERSLHALYAAAMGLQVRRPVYEKDAEVEAATAARDLRGLVAAGWLVARGETRGRYYVASPELREIRRAVVGERIALVDPYHR